MKLFTMEQADLAKRQGAITAGEIMQQPDLWQETAAMLAERRAALTAFLQPILAVPNLRIIITGAGTSAYVGDIVAPYLRRQYGLRVDSIATTDLVANPENYFEKDTPTILISCARSGNSPESVASYELGEQCVTQLYQIVVTCNAQGSLAQKAAGKHRALLLTMPERSNDQGFAMTGSFSCMVLTLLLLFERDGDAKKEWVQGLIAGGRRILQDEATVLSGMVAEKWSRIVYLGSSSLRALSQEAALKTLELASGRIVALSESVLGFRHGPKCIVNENTLVVMFISGDAYTRQYELDLLRELRREQQGYKVVAISYTPYPELSELADHVFVVQPEATAGPDDAYAALTYILYAQMYALLQSLALGITPDNPRPDGTVNRVVQGVVIHEYQGSTSA